MDTSDLVSLPARRHRRRHSAEFKASVIAACGQPGISIAAVAMANGLNANLLRRWVAEAEQLPHGHAATIPSAAPVLPSGFVPLQLPAPTLVADIRVDVRRGNTSITVTWPVDAATACATWLSALLR